MHARRMVDVVADVFRDRSFAFELGHGLSFKYKQKLNKLVTDHGGKISFMVNKKVNILPPTSKISPQC